MKYIIKSCMLLTLLVVISVSLPSCVTSAHSVEIQNKSETPAVVYARHYYDGQWGDTHNLGQVEPSKTQFLFSMIEPDSKSTDEKYQVEVRSSDGKLIKSWEFPFQNRILLVIEKTVMTGQ
jgi:hypothetical protein